MSKTDLLRRGNGVPCTARYNKQQVAVVVGCINSEWKHDVSRTAGRGVYECRNALFRVVEGPE